MINDLDREAASFGLKLHAGKTKVFATNPLARQTPIACDGLNVEVLQEGASEKYLGRKFSVDEFRNAEFNNRLAMGWAALFKFKGALCNRQLSLKHRMALFEATVTPSVLYACGTWTVTAEMLNKLRGTQRRMLQWMIRTARRTDEPWPDYISRATHAAEAMAVRCGCKCWCDVQHERKCRLAAKASMSLA